MLNSTTGHSPYPEENQRIAKEDDDEATRWGLDICRETTNFFQRYSDKSVDWRFEWPIEYNSSDGDCALLQMFIDLIRANCAVNPDDISDLSILKGSIRLYREFMRISLRFRHDLDEVGSISVRLVTCR